MKKKLGQKIEASKFLLEQDYKDKKEKKTKKIETKHETESEPDEEVVIIERKKKPKKNS